MLDGITLDQLRTFVAAVDTGSFSAAGRHLGRAQSVVSQTLATMEERLGITLFDRTARYPVLTVQGESLVADARTVLSSMNSFKGRARNLSEGLEPSVVVTVDVMVPFDIVSKAASAFEERFPTTDLHLSVEALGATVASVLEGRSMFAITGPLALESHSLTTQPFYNVPMCAVASPAHPVAGMARAITREELSAHRQLVLADRSELTAGRQFGVLSPSAWRVYDLSAKLAFLKAGLGWGAMPRDVVAGDLRHGTLVELEILGADPAWAVMKMYSAWLSSRPPGIAGRWLLDRLSTVAAEMNS